MISTDEDYTGEKCVLSDRSKIPFTQQGFPLGPRNTLWLVLGRNSQFIS